MHLKIYKFCCYWVECFIYACYVNWLILLFMSSMSFLIFYIIFNLLLKEES